MSTENKVGPETVGRGLAAAGFTALVLAAARRTNGRVIRGLLYAWAAVLLMSQGILAQKVLREHYGEETKLWEAMWMEIQASRKAKQAVNDFLAGINKTDPPNKPPTQRSGSSS